VRRKYEEINNGTYKKRKKETKEERNRTGMKERAG
jgi:hypothetical protein